MQVLGQVHHFLINMHVQSIYSDHVPCNSYACSKHVLNMSQVYGMNVPCIFQSSAKHVHPMHSSSIFNHVPCRYQTCSRYVPCMEYFTSVTTDSLWMVVRGKLGVANRESRRWHILIVDESKKKGSEMNGKGRML